MKCSFKIVMIFAHTFFFLHTWESASSSDEENGVASYHLQRTSAIAAGRAPKVSEKKKKEQDDQPLIREQPNNKQSESLYFHRQSQECEKCWDSCYWCLRCWFPGVPFHSS